MSEVKRWGHRSQGGVIWFEERDDGKYCSYEDYAAIKAQRDALAAENGRMKKAIKRIFHEGVADEKSGIGFSDIAKECYASADETPATDAYLNSVRAEGVEMLTGKLQQLIDEGVFDAKEIGIAAGAVYEGAQIAAQLRGQ